MDSTETTLQCRCGTIGLEIHSTPIISVECLCADCQAAASILEALPNAAPILDAKGATRFELYRKDRVRIIKGEDQLREHRLTEGSSTRRIVATCCNTPIFLDFTTGHWLSIYGGLWPVAGLPPLDMRTMTRSRPAGIELPNDVPNPKTHNFTFYRKLLGAWVAMGFKTPKLDFIDGVLDIPS